MKINPLNLFNPAMKGTQGANPAQRLEQPVQPIQAVMGGSNPFAPKKDNESQGVGLVQSNLQNMSYRLPNGKNSTCNTIGIC